MAVRDDVSGLRLAPHEKRSPRGRLWTALAIGVPLVGLTIFAVWRTDLFQALKPQSDKEAAAAVPETQPDTPDGVSTSNSAVNMVAAGGYIEAKRLAVVLPQRDGLVANVHIERGQVVRQGEVLLELDSDMIMAEIAFAKADVARAEARLQRIEAGSREEEIVAAHAEVKAAEADLEDARRDVIRLEKLAQKDAVPATEIDDARYREQSSRAKVEELEARERLLRKGNRPSDFLEAQAEVERAEAALRQTEVSLDQSSLRAPFDGVVTRINLEPGEIVSLMNFQKGDAGIEIADLSELVVKVDVPETRIAHVALQSPAEVTINALGERPLEGVVVEIAPMADRQSNTVEVAVRILSPPPLVRPDMSARVAIKTNQEEIDE